MKLMDEINQLKKNGFCILSGVFNNLEINQMRDEVIAHLKNMAKTQNREQSYHLAGFHRYPSLFRLHSNLLSNQRINVALKNFYGAEDYITIGLSDVTINRSQHWHTDLLRGKYSSYLASTDPWDPQNIPCLKALVYLQAGKGLRVISGSHQIRTKLNDKDIYNELNLKNVQKVEVATGDVVLIDIRLIHRGSTEIEMNSPQLVSKPKILVSTVFGKVNVPITNAIQIGNFFRNIDWDQKWLKNIVKFKN